MLAVSGPCSEANISPELQLLQCEPSQRGKTPLINALSFNRLSNESTLSKPKELKGWCMPQRLGGIIVKFEAPTLGIDCHAAVTP